MIPAKRVRAQELMAEICKSDQEAKKVIAETERLTIELTKRNEQQVSLLQSSPTRPSFDSNAALYLVLVCSALLILACFIIQKLFFSVPVLTVSEKPRWAT